MNLAEALDELGRIAPTAPLLALGQTVFWDEPMKGGIEIFARKSGKARKLIAGVHDTDYFAKLPKGPHADGKFKAFPHNDTTTKGLWSAAAEFSALFGSETVVTKEALLHAGLRLEKVLKGRPELLDEATEAWGWRGIVALGDDAPIAADVKMSDLYPELKATLDWAIDLSLTSVCEPNRKAALRRAEDLKGLVAEAYDAHPDGTLGEFYERLLPRIYDLASGEHVELEHTRTTQLLKFNRKTCVQPRFDLVNLFVSPDSAEIACNAYNEALRGSEIYGLERFGTGAIPFDLVIPGHGRGTIRIARRAVVIMTREPQFINLKQPLRHVQDLADAVCNKFGNDCVLIGKAVTLIGMLAREFVFLFHEGASGYVKYSRKFHDLLFEENQGLKMNPILRVKLNVWDALQECSTWIRLPEPFQRPFGTEELTAPSFAGRWLGVVQQQKALLDELGSLRRPLDLISFLERQAGGSWNCLACEYNELHGKLEKLERQVGEIKAQRQRCYQELKELKRQRTELERAMGDHFRAKVFEKTPSGEELQRREQYVHDIEQTVHQIVSKQREIRELMHRQAEFVSAPEIRALHERRRAIELEAELKRLRLIRQAVITSRGLERANYRPAAWWFPLLCPDGGWFKAAIARAECYLEPLSSG